MIKTTRQAQKGGHKAKGSNPAAPRKSNLLALAAGSVSALFATQSAQATSGIWNGTTDGNWNSTTNWSNPTAPATGDTATFANAGNGNTTITIDSGRVVKNIIFDPTLSTLGNYTIGSAGANAGNTLNVNANGNISIGTGAGVTGLTETFNAPISFAGNYNFINNQLGAGSNLVFACNITNIGNSTLNLSGNGTGTGNLISGSISDGAGGTVQSLTFTDSAGKWTLSGVNSYTGKTTLGSATSTAFLSVNTLASGGSNSSIGASGNGSSNLVFINASTLQYTGATVSTDRAFSLAVNTTATIDVTNAAANLTMVGDTGGVQASQNFTKTGAGTLTLTGAQTSVGATTVNGGTLSIDMNAGGSLASTSAPTLGGGTLQIKGANNTASTQTLGNLTLTGNTSNTIKLSPTGGGGGVTLTLGNTWNRGPTGGSTLNVDLSAANTPTLASQPIASAASQTTTGPIVNYATVTDSSGTGFATVINNNVVRYTAAAPLLTNSSGSGTNYVTKVGDAGYSGSTLTLTAGLHKMGSVQLNTDGGTGILDLGGNTGGNATATTFLVTGGNSSNNFTIENGSIGSTATGGRETIIHQFAAGTLTISATVGVSTNTSSLVKDGPGTMILTAPNPYVGLTVIGGGVLRATDGTGLPTASLLIMNNGVFETGAATFTRTLGSASGNVQITGGASGFSANGGPVAVSIGGTGTETALTWGSASFNPGTLVLNESTANNTLDFKNAIDLSGSTRTINVNAAGANTATISGVLSSSSVGGGLVKGGIGTLKLTNTNSYRGVTTISGGTLALSTSSSTNNVANSSAIVVGTNGTLDVTAVTATGGFALNGTSAQVLGGTGTVSGNVTVAAGAILSAGTSTTLGTGAANANGTLTTGNQTWGAAGKYSVKITDATGALGAGTGWDSIAMAALSATGTGTSLSTAFNIDPVGTLTSVANGTTWAIATTTSRALVNGSTNDGTSIATAPNLLTDGSNAFALDTSGFSVNGVSGSSLLGFFKLELVQSGSTDTLDLTYNATPEPGTAMLVLGGALPMLMGRRRRRKQA